MKRRTYTMYGEGRGVESANKKLRKTRFYWRLLKAVGGRGRKFFSGKIKEN